MTATQSSTPNHHADYPGFAGVTGLLAAATMVLGREDSARLAVRLAGLGPGDALVDVGCGPGAAVRHAAKVATTVVGVDPAPVMLRVARVLTRSSDTVRFAEGAAEALPLADASASVVWSIACVHHWADLDAGLHEARRVLKSGGRFVAIERRRPPDARGLAAHGWTDEQARAFAEECRAHGFIDARVDRHQRGRKSMVSVTARVPVDNLC